MRKSASLKNFVFLLESCCESGCEVGTVCQSCQAGMAAEHGWSWFLTRWKKPSSAVSNRSATVSTSPAQYPSRLPQRRSDSRRNPFSDSVRGASLVGNVFGRWSRASWIAAASRQTTRVLRRRCADRRRLIRRRWRWLFSSRQDWHTVSASYPLSQHDSD